MTTPRENMLRLLSHEKSEWRPCCFHVSNRHNIPGCLPPDLLKEPLDRLAISKYLGGDLLYEIYPVKILFSESISIRNSGSGNISVREISTPLGSLCTQSEKSVIKSIPSGNELPEGTVSSGDSVISTITRFPLREKEDYKTLQYLFENMRFELDMEVIDKALAGVGNDGIVVIGGGMPSPLYGLINDYTGLEQFIYDYTDYPDLLKETMEIIFQKSCEWYSVASRSGAQVIRGTDDLDANLVSPAMVREHSVPYVRKYADICHQNGKTMILHMCGNIKEFLTDIKTTGIDAIHCLCPPPTGNTPLNYAHKVLNDDIVMMVRPDPITLTTGTPEKVTENIHAILKEVAGLRNFILIVPCGRAPLENLMAVKNVMQQHEIKQ